MSSFNSSVGESAIQYPLTLPAGRLSRTTKLLVGELLLGCLPARGRKVLAEGDPMQFSRLDRLLLAGHIARARKTGEWAPLSQVQQRFWSGQGGMLFNSVRDVADRFESWFLGKHQAIVEALAAEIGDGSGWLALNELGSGNGLALDYLSRRFPALPMLRGIDLNSEAATANTARYANGRLQFITAEASAWVAGNAGPQCIWFSNAGVLEYLPEASVACIYQTIAKTGAPALFALVEPLAASHDLHTHHHSLINEGEHSYSHNHAVLLKAAGWSLCYQTEMPLAGLRWQLLVAMTPAP